MKRSMIHVILLIYCLLAIFWLLAQLVLTYNQQRALSNEVGMLQSDLNEAEQRRSHAERVLAAGRASQRAGRAAMPGDEAIVASTEVQAALTAYERAAARYDEFSSLLGRATAELERLRLRFVPLGVALLVHVAMGLLLLPQRPVVRD